MRYFLFVLLFIFSTQGFSKEMLMRCQQPGYEATLYKIINNKVLKRKNGKWFEQGINKKKIIKSEKIIFEDIKRDSRVYNSEVFDLRELTWSFYFTLTDHSEPSTKMASIQCEAL